MNGHTASMSASFQMISGLLPPNSIVMCFTVSATFLRICLPTSVLPVKVI